VFGVAIGRFKAVGPGTAEITACCSGVGGGTSGPRSLFTVTVQVTG
jgi:hypothetical protein